MSGGEGGGGAGQLGLGSERQEDDTAQVTRGCPQVATVCAWSGGTPSTPSGLVVSVCVWSGGTPHPLVVSVSAGTGGTPHPCVRGWKPHFPDRLHSYISMWQGGFLYTDLASSVGDVASVQLWQCRASRPIQCRAPRPTHCRVSRPTQCRVSRPTQCRVSRPTQCCVSGCSFLSYAIPYHQASPPCVRPFPPPFT